MDLEQRITQQFADHIETITTAASLTAPIARAASSIVESLLRGGKVISCGNGGSAAASQHFMAKMVHRFERERPGLPAVAISAGSSTMTSVADEISYDRVFSQQVSALAHPGDVLLAISCSGNSNNLLRAVEAAEERQMTVVALTGNDGGQLAGMLREQDVEIRVPTESVSRIQETQLLVIHCLCDLIDVQLLGS